MTWNELCVNMAKELVSTLAKFHPLKCHNKYTSLRRSKKIENVIFVKQFMPNFIHWNVTIITHHGITEKDQAHASIVQKHLLAEYSQKLMLNGITKKWTYYKCNYCTKAFAWRILLEAHVKWNHEKMDILQMQPLDQSIW